MKKLIIFGGKGNGTVLSTAVEDINEEEKRWEILGFINDKEKNKINNYPVLGSTSSRIFEKYLKYKDVYFYWTFFSLKLKQNSLKKLNNLNIPKKKFATLIHPKASVPKKTVVGNGVSIHAFVNISANVKIGNHIQIYSNSNVGHDTEVEDFTFISMSSSIGSHVKLKEGCFVGNNACIREKTVIGKWSTIGLGSVVLNSVKEKSIVAGNPAKKL